MARQIRTRATIRIRAKASKNPKFATGFIRPSVGALRGMFFRIWRCAVEFSAPRYSLTILPRANWRFRRISGVVMNSRKVPS